MLILRGLGVPPEAPDNHDKLRFLQPPLRERVKQQTKQILIDDELRRRRTNKMQMIAEGAEAQRVDKEANERKRKAADKAAWEGALLSMSYIIVSPEWACLCSLCVCFYRIARDSSHRLAKLPKRRSKA